MQQVLVADDQHSLRQPRGGRARTLETLDAIAEARIRIEGNVAPALALEAVLVSAVRNPETVPAPSGKDIP